MGGPTAAGQVLAGIRWWNRQIGTRFATEHRHVSRFDGAATGHAAAPAGVLLPADVLNLLALARQRCSTQGLVLPDRARCR